MNKIVLKQIEILKYIKELCDANSIRYTIADDLLVASLQGIVTLDGLNECTILMTPTNYIKFLKVNSDNVGESFSYENVDSNLFFSRTCTYVVAEDSLFLDPTRERLKHEGIYVKVKMLWPRAPASTIQKLLIALRSPMSKIVGFASFLPFALRLMFAPFALVHRYLVRSAIRRACKLETNGARRYVHHMTKQKLPIVVKNSELKYAKKVNFMGLELMTLKILRQENSTFVTQLKKHKLKFKLNDLIVCSSTAGYRDFQSFKTDLSAFKVYLYETIDVEVRAKIARLDQHKFSHKNYLPAVAAAFLRIKFRHKLKSKKPELIKALAASDFKTIQSILNEYEEEFQIFLNNGKVLVFDQMIFNIFVEYMRCTGKSHIVKKALRLANKKDLLGVDYIYDQ